MDFGFVLRTQKDRQVISRTFPCRYQKGYFVALALANAAMILSGMGPVSELKTTSGKIFAGSYAIFSGLVIVIAATFVLAPILNRILHRFHVAAIEIRLI
jgi:hypothetical protein